MTLLEVEDLAVTFRGDREVRAVDGVSFTVD
ncbi:MAG: ABC transporter ATP-binding protein, partial [Kribbellaceae bacterium]|nr:ABC transporter ATP-binding protein [Kribbellaceae bacterium]